MDNVIELANELESVMVAKEFYLQSTKNYLKAIENYKQKAKESGVTDETVNYILFDPTVTVKESINE